MSDPFALTGGEWVFNRRTMLHEWAAHPDAPPAPNLCLDCSTEITKGSLRCRPCANAARQAPPVPKPKSIKHGTYAGYVAHRKQRVDQCEPCRLAGSAYNRERRQRRKEAA